jgi:acyl-CoA thioesterase-1
MKRAYGLGTSFRKAVLSFGLLFALMTASAVAQPVRLLVLGDSLTAGYGLAQPDGFQARLAAALAAKGLQVTLIDGAVSGDTSAGGLARLDWVLAGGPSGGPNGSADAAIVELGANDGLRGSDPAAMEANLNAILDRLAARHIKVLLTGMHAAPNLGADYTSAYDAVFKRLSQRPGLIYDPFFLEGVAAIPGLNQADGIHPNPEGVRLIVARLLPLVEQLVAEARKGAEPPK